MKSLKALTYACAWRLNMPRGNTYLKLGRWQRHESGDHTVQIMSRLPGASQCYCHTYPTPPPDLCHTYPTPLPHFPQTSATLTPHLCHTSPRPLPHLPHTCATPPPLPLPHLPHTCATPPPLPLPHLPHTCATPPPLPLPHSHTRFQTIICHTPPHKANTTATLLPSLKQRAATTLPPHVPH